MNSKYPYALYLDSKILGTARQLISFYERGVFSAKNTIIYLKKYKKSAREFSRLFIAKGIPFKFMKPRELDDLKGQIIFYAFNAQSNCRFVANRNLKHIFITHGESNKISSIKPIIRIYDHVVMSGRLSLERYYNSGLFDEHDYKTGRLIMMGDTFIGKTGFSQKDSGKPVVFYAPTWEGGLATEDYSSLQNIQLVENTILQTLAQLHINELVIQAHPNLGHRLSGYIDNLIVLLKRLAKKGVKLYLYRNHVNFDLFQRIRLSLLDVETVTSLSNFTVQHALIDISAMESQCINEGINYYSFYKQDCLRQDIPEIYRDRYQKLGIELSSDSKTINIENVSYGIKQLSSMLCDYSFSDILNTPFEQRLEKLGELK